MISIFRFDVSEGQQIQFEEETVTAPSGDFLFVVGYSTSKPFGSYDSLKRQLKTRDGNLNLCVKCAEQRHFRSAADTSVSEN